MGLFDIFKINQFKQEIGSLQSERDRLQQELDSLQSERDRLQQELDNLGFKEYSETKKALDEMNQKHSALEKEYADKKMSHETAFGNQVANDNAIIYRNQKEITEKIAENEKYQKQITTNINKLKRIKELYKSAEYTTESFHAGNEFIGMTSYESDEMEGYAPSVTLKLHCIDMKDLRKAYRENQKTITKLLDLYAARYTTKANQAIYKLMVIALEAELQNILYNLKYEKLEQSIDLLKQVTVKYLAIAGDGNQSIAGTLTKFIGEVEYLFINAIKIEYNYYVRKEQARQEQLAIKAQMKQEAEERKALEAERKKVEQEEQKYKDELEKLNNQLVEGDDAESQALRARILELESQLSNVFVKKEEIVNLQNGKAGNVYIISNIGSFGEDVFKVGMTRRIDPRDRVRELGDASVPFRYDVHSFIFSEDAVGLEGRLHEALNSKRLNKVNLRREFFKVSIDELEELVLSIDETAEFNRTFIAEEFHQSQSVDYTGDTANLSYYLDDIDEDEDSDEE